ncbi:hypothetical protein Tco_1534849 [Tanacetum coccineum]
MRPYRLLRLLSDFDGKIRYHLGKASIASDALSKNERAKPLRIHEARVETLKKENVKDENLYGMDKEFENRLDGTLCIRRRMVIPMARYGSMHHHLCQQVLDASKDEGRLPEAIRITSTTRNTPLEMGKYSHGFYHKTIKDNKQLRHHLDEPLAIPLDEIQIDDKLNFIEEPVKIMDRKVKRLKQSRIPIVKVRWNSRRGPEFTWEREDQMKKKYPHIFVNPSSTS